MRRVSSYATALNTASQSSIKISAIVILGLEDDLKSKFYNRFESFKHLSDLEILQE